jgi:hypothetical protein
VSIVTPDCDQVLANLRVGWEVARPDPLTQDGRRTSLGRVIFVRADRVEPAWCGLLSLRDDLSEKATRGFLGNLLTQASRRRRNPIATAKSVVHFPFTSSRFILTAFFQHGNPAWRLVGADWDDERQREKAALGAV